jgi:hypothetical protein
MNLRLVLCCVLGVLLLAIPCTSQAQWRRYGRSGVVQGPNGPLYDTRSPEWRMSGGNIFVYEQLMEQKMMLQQQKLMMRQQQMQMRQMQQAARKGAGRAAAPAAIRQNGAVANDQQGGTLPPRRKRKTPATAGINASAGSTRKKVGPTSNPDSVATPKSGAASPAPLEPPNSP